MTSINKNRTAKLMLWLLIAILLSNMVLGLGIAPSRIVLNYDAGSSKTHTARVLNDEHKSLKMLIYAKGEYADYIEIENNVLTLSPEEGEKSFTYTINMPEKMRPGPNKLEIVAMQLPDDGQVVVVDGEVVSLHEKKVAITSVLSLIHQVIINVPYPGVFAEGKLYVTPGGVGEDTTFAISVFNRGNQPIDAAGYVIIKGPTNEEIARVQTNDATIQTEGVGKLVANWKADVNAGKYYAEATITYNGKSFTLEEVFEVGNLFIEIVGIRVKNFRLGSIAKFDIDLLSKWNQPIDNVQGELQIMDEHGSLLDEFETNSVSIPARGEETISGYWDTEGASIGNYDVNVMLHYSGKKTQKLFETVVSTDSIQFKDTALVGQVTLSDQEGDRYTLLVVLVLILIIINIALFIYFKRRGGNNNSSRSSPGSSSSSPSYSPPSNPNRTSTTTTARDNVQNRTSDYNNPEFEK